MPVSERLLPRSGENESNEQKVEGFRALERTKS